jgi:hypothetical protein
MAQDRDQNFSDINEESVDTPFLGAVEMEMSEESRAAVQRFCSRMARALKGAGDAFRELEEFLREEEG